MWRVSPRPAPRRDDATAQRFLGAAAQLLEAAMGDGTQPLPPRLRAIKFPAALDWLRVEDVLRIAQTDGEVDGKRAFRNRWPSKDDFLRDVVLYCLEYRDAHGLSAPQAYAARAMLLDGDTPFSQRVDGFAPALVRELVTNPRSYLLAHIAPMLLAHPELKESLVEFTREDVERWKAVYEDVLTMLGAELRPGWNLDSLALSLQCLLDGLVLRHRIDPQHSPISNWAQASLVTDAALALIVASIDLDGTRKSTSQWVDELVAAKMERDGARATAATG